MNHWFLGGSLKICVAGLVFFRFLLSFDRLKKQVMITAAIGRTVPPGGNEDFHVALDDLLGNVLAFPVLQLGTVGGGWNEKKLSISPS